MLGHLVSNGYAAAPQSSARPVAARAAAPLAAAGQPTWLGRLLAQWLNRR